MPPAFRRFVLWLVLLVLPLQAVAAVGLRVCEPDHHHAGQAVASDAGHHADVAHDAHHHEPISPDGSTYDAGSHAPGDGKCSACAACCVGASMPVSMFTTVWTPQTLRHAPVQYRSHIAFYTEGPERPPRLSLA